MGIIIGASIAIPSKIPGFHPFGVTFLLQDLQYFSLIQITLYFEPSVHEGRELPRPPCCHHTQDTRLFSISTFPIFDYFFDSFQL